MSDQHWSALVIRPDDRLDADLLAAITLAARVTFGYVGAADFGTRTDATVYAATADLLERALEHPDQQVREAADYAMRMSKAWTSFCGVS